jgi:hypothetical protein
MAFGTQKHFVFYTKKAPLAPRLDSYEYAKERTACIAEKKASIMQNA